MSAGPADQALDLFKSLVFDQITKMAISQILGLSPFLAWGPVAFIVGQAVAYVAGVLYNLLKDTINLEVILLKNAAFHKAYVEAAYSINRIAKEKGIDSPEFRKARDAHKAALSQFVRYNGT